MKNLVVCTALLLLAGCATMTQRAMGGILDSWQGEPIAKVIAVWGPPTYTHGDLYQWTDSQRQGLVGVETTRGSSDPGLALIKGSCTRQLIVSNVSGTVQSGTFYGSNCCVAAVSGYCKSLKNPARG